MSGIHDAPTPEGGGISIDPLEAALGEIVRGQQANSRELNAIGRDIATLKKGIANVAERAKAVSDKTDAVTEEFARLHGIIQGLEHTEAEERKRMHRDIKLILNHVQNLSKRMAPLESRVAGTELQLSLQDDDGKPSRQ